LRYDARGTATHRASRQGKARRGEVLLTYINQPEAVPVNATIESPEATAARESKVRRMAARQELKVCKSRRRDPDHPDHGTYQIIDPWRNAVVECAWGSQDGYGLTLDEVEDYLTAAK
jgi:hypothetical protein